MLTFKKLLLPISAWLWITHCLAAPMMMHLNERALHSTSLVVVNASSLSGYQRSPLIFPPKLFTSPTAFTIPQSATTEGQGVFKILAPAGTLLRAQILPQAGGFPLDGNQVAGSIPPTVQSTNFNSVPSGLVDSSGNFTMGSTGSFDLTLGGGLFGSSSTLGGFYRSNSDLMLQITNRTTGISIQIPFQIYFSYIVAGQLGTVRSLVFPTKLLTPGIISTQNVNPGTPESAELNYSPSNGSFTILTPTVCLTTNGSPPPASCSSCTGTTVRVTLGNTGTISTSCSGSTCKVFVGGGACYPANLPAGTYTGMGSIQMTYS